MYIAWPSRAKFKILGAAISRYNKYGTSSGNRPSSWYVFEVQDSTSSVYNVVKPEITEDQNDSVPSQANYWFCRKPAVA
eukprot:1577735-Rhodomonas_salina.1